MTVLAGLFYMLSVLLYIKGRVAHLDSGETKAWKPWAFYAGAVIAGGLGFLSKQNAATFPLAFILAEILFIRNAEGRHDRKFLITLSSVIGGLLILGISIAGIPSEYEKISRSEYLYTQFRVLVKYWQLLFLPVNQHLDYYWRVSNSLWGWKELTSLAFLLATLAAAVLLFRKNWIIPAFAIFWFYLTLSIESSIIPIRDVIFEHRLYMAVYGFGFAISYLAFYFLGKKKVLVPVLILGAITLAYAGASINRNSVWKTPYTLWTDSVEKSPKRERAWYWLASYYTSERDPQNALRCYETSIQCNPNFPLAYNGRGNIRKESGDLDGALTDYTRAIELDPNYVTAYYNRGIALAAKNKLTDAIKDYDRSVSLGNSSSAVYYNRANAKRRKGLYDSAIEDYNKAISIDPRYPLAFFNRGLTKSAKKNQEGAIKDIDKAISLDPNNHLFYNGKGVSYMNMGKYEDAVKEFDRSVQLNPGFGQAFYNRGYAKFNGLGDLSGACADWNKALQLDYRQARRYLDQYCK
jgi:tetratricopeptide (TPR) repeat protein